MRRGGLFDQSEGNDDVAAQLPGGADDEMGDRLPAGVDDDAGHRTGAPVRADHREPQVHLPQRRQIRVHGGSVPFVSPGGPIESHDGGWGYGSEWNTQDLLSRDGPGSMSRS